MTKFFSVCVIVWLIVVGNVLASDNLFFTLEEVPNKGFDIIVDGAGQDDMSFTCFLDIETVPQCSSLEVIEKDWPSGINWMNALNKGNDFIKFMAAGIYSFEEKFCFLEVRFSDYTGNINVTFDRAWINGGPTEPVVGLDLSAEGLTSGPFEMQIPSSVLPVPNVQRFGKGKRIRGQMTIECSVWPNGFPIIWEGQTIFLDADGGDPPYSWEVSDAWSAKYGKYVWQKNPGWRTGNGLKLSISKNENGWKELPFPIYITATVRDARRHPDKASVDILLMSLDFMSLAPAKLIGAPPKNLCVKWGAIKKGR